jgi:hypothetical protein
MAQTRAVFARSKRLHLVTGDLHPDGAKSKMHHQGAIECSAQHVGGAVLASPQIALA